MLSPPLENRSPGQNKFKGPIFHTARWPQNPIELAGIRAARRVFEDDEWGGMGLRARCRLVNRLAGVMEAHLGELFALETLNNGRPIRETRPRSPGRLIFSAITPALPWRGGIR